MSPIVKKAVWGAEYDFRTDSIYDCPKCPDCDMPIFDFERSICDCCEEKVELSEDMIKWHEERTGTKEEVLECTQCGQKKLKAVFTKNVVTKEWQMFYGQCECGCRFIV